MFTPPNLASTGAPPKAMIASSRSSPVLIYAKIVSFTFLTCFIPKVHFVFFVLFVLVFVLVIILKSGCLNLVFEKWKFHI